MTALDVEKYICKTYGKESLRHDPHALAEAINQTQQDMDYSDEWHLFHLLIENLIYTGNRCCKVHLFIFPLILFDINNFLFTLFYCNEITWSVKGRKRMTLVILNRIKTKY